MGRSVCTSADSQGVTRELLSAESVGGCNTDADSRAAVEARHRALDPTPEGEPSETTVILRDWASYGRHAAPTSVNHAGRTLPALPLRPREAAPAARPECGEKQAGADLDVGTNESSGCLAGVDDDSSAPNSETAPARGMGSAVVVSALGRRSQGPVGHTTAVSAGWARWAARVAAGLRKAADPAFEARNPHRTSGRPRLAGP